VRKIKDMKRIIFELHLSNRQDTPEVVMMKSDVASLIQENQMLRSRLKICSERLTVYEKRVISMTEFKEATEKESKAQIMLVKLMTGIYGPHISKLDIADLEVASKVFYKQLYALPSDLGDLLIWKYQGEYSLKELSDKLGLSRERIRQKIAKGVRLMRHPSRFKVVIAACPEIAGE